MTLVCTPVARCAYHADGGSKRSKCPGYCDRRGCRELATDDGLCAAHASPRPAGRPVSTGSRGTPVVAFRLGAVDHARAGRVAKRERVTVGELARRALLAHLS